MEPTVSVASYPRGVRDVEDALGTVVRRLCPRDLDPHVDDITQQVLLRMHRALEATEGPRVLTPSYQWRVAQSAVVDHVRRQKSQQRLKTSLSHHQSGAVPARGLQPEVQVAGREIGQAIGVCLGRLIASRRRAVVSYLQGHSVPEIARQLDCGTKRAENLVYRGLADLRSSLREMGIEP